MAFEDILNRILDDAKKKARGVEDEARTQARRIVEDSKKKAKSFEAKSLEEAKFRAQEEGKRMLSLTRLEARNLVLAQKRAALDAALEEALKKLISLPDGEYGELVKKILLEAAVTGEEEVIVSPSDRKRFETILGEVNADLRKKGRKGKLKLSQETRGLNGGFILRSDGVEINNSFSAILDSLREELEPDLLKILLPQGG